MTERCHFIDCTGMTLAKTQQVLKSVASSLKSNDPYGYHKVVAVFLEN
jgi:hypothetical protein